MDTKNRLFNDYYNQIIDKSNMRIYTTGFIGAEVRNENTRKCVQSFEKNEFTIINKIRQAGISTVLLAYSLTNLGKKVFYFSPKIVHRDMIHQIGNSDHIKFLTPKTSPYVNIDFKNSIVILDEAAWMDDGFWTSILPLFENTKVIIASSPYKKEGFFYNIWKSDNTDFNKILINSDGIDKESLFHLKGIYSKEEFAMSLENEFIDIPKVGSKTISLRLDEDLYDKLVDRISILSKIRNVEVTLSNFLRELIIENTD